MWIWVVIIVSGLCTLSSFYMTMTAFKVGDNGVFLFSGFGLFFGYLLVISLIRAAAAKGLFVKRGEEKISGNSGPVSFVPHWFMMSVLIIAAIATLATIFIPIFDAH
jgi:hypothetical protein